MDDAVGHFVRDNVAPDVLQELRSNLRCAFAQLQDDGAALSPLAVVTSGGTDVALERRAVRVPTNFSTGMRGAAMTEELLRRGWRVVFASKRGSVAPFRRVEPTDAAVKVVGSAVSIDDAAYVAEVAARQRFSHRCATVPFSSVGEYIALLAELPEAVRCGGGAALVVLAAAVSDYFVPFTQMAPHKISGGDLSLTLHQVPKALGWLTARLPPTTPVVSFKLETDAEVLEEKALRGMDSGGTAAVVANLLGEHRLRATLYRRGASAGIAVTAPPQGGPLESPLVEAIIRTVVNQS